MEHIRTRECTPQPKKKHERLQNKIKHKENDKARRSITHQSRNLIIRDTTRSQTPSEKEELNSKIKYNTIKNKKGTASRVKKEILEKRYDSFKGQKNKQEVRKRKQKII